MVRKNDSAAKPEPPIKNKVENQGEKQVEKPAEKHQLIVINLTEIIRKRLGSRGKYIPGFLLRALERLICQERLNEILRKLYPAEGSAFAKGVLDELKITLEVEGLEKLPEGEAFEFASNHPLGGLDGITLVSILGGHYGDENLRVLVNDMLMNVIPLSNVFLPINKYGSQGRQSAEAISEAYASGKQIVMFPAGLVSRLHPDGVIRDLQWQKAFVVKALEHGRRIVPIHFEGLNSMKFYKTAKWRKKLGIKVNLEQALLPSELCKAEGNHFKVTFGEPIDVCVLRAAGLKPKEIAEKVREASGN